MHLLYIYRTYATETVGGIEQLMRQLGYALTPMGARVSVATMSRAVTRPDVIEDNGITVHRYPLLAEVASNGISLSMAREFRTLAAEADILHYQAPWPTGDLLHQLAPKQVPAVVSYQADIVRQKWLKLAYTPLMHRFLRQMDAIIATTPDYMASSPVLPRYADKTTCIPIGLDETSYPRPDAERLAQWKARLPQNFFLFVGVLRYYKGLHTLIEAARLTGLPVVIAGEGPEGERLRAQAADLPHVHFTGHIDDTDKMALLQLCRGFAFPSHLRAEAYGISLLEAAMSGKPMISCDIRSGMNYINPHGQTGFQVPPQDAPAFADAMRRLAEDAELAARLGANARQRFESLFTAQKMAEAHMALYQSLLRDKKDAA